MKDIIKQTLDEYSKNYKQINLDSEASRVILASLIEKRLKLWQNQKDLVNIKKNAD